MSGPSTLVLCRQCGWDRPYEWFLERRTLEDFTNGERVTYEGDCRVKVCRACRDHRYEVEA